MYASIVFLPLLGSLIAGWLSLGNRDRAAELGTRRGVPAEAARDLEAHLRSLGKDVTLTVHSAGHAFMSPHDALGSYDEELAESIWPEVTSFLHQELG